MPLPFPVLMSSAGGLVVPAFAALAAAFAFGVAAALQHRQAGLARRRRGPSLQLLADAGFVGIRVTVRPDSRDMIASVR